MDKKDVAVKCFVYAMRWNRDRRIQKAWVLRGLRLWQEATGQDMGQEIANVKRGMEG